MVETIRFHRGRLPHWTVAERAYFVTICQKGCIPEEVLAEIKARSHDEHSRFVSIDEVLHHCSERFRVLHHPPLSERLMAAVEWLEADRRGWVLHAACIMPTHIHIVMRNSAGRSGELERDLASFKNYTARICNKELRRKGRFWAKESFDHWCRDEDSVRRAVSYTLRNPARAHLVPNPTDWPLSIVGDQYAALAGAL